MKSLEIDIIEQVNSRVSSSSSSGAKGALRSNMSNCLGSTFALSRVVIGWFYEPIVQIASHSPLKNMYPQRSFLSFFGSEEESMHPSRLPIEQCTSL